jgi:phosphatidate phosphatase APP1
MTPPLSASFVLVSDFDDTLKISHTTNRLRTVFRGLFAKQAYAGMSELYQEWNAGHPFIILSSSPRMIAGKIGRFLDRNGYPEREIWLRDWIKQKDIRNYKLESLRKLESRPDPAFIFIGDDAEYDPEVFASFREKNPNRTLAIYIRRMRGRPLPDGVVPFHSAMEIALSELAAGRLKIPQVSRIGKAIVDQRESDQVIPYFAAAPTEISVPDDYPTLEKIVDQINARYAKIRQERKPK